MPTFKTTSFHAFSEDLNYVFKHLGFLLAFSAEQVFQRWRFTRFRLREQALDALARRLVPRSSPHVWVGYGD